MFDHVQDYTASESHIIIDSYLYSVNLHFVSNNIRKILSNVPLAVKISVTMKARDIKFSMKVPVYRMRIRIISNLECLSSLSAILI